MGKVARDRVALILAGVLFTGLTGCATTGGQTEARCYPHIYLDSRYEIRGTYTGAGATVDEDNCYRFTYRDGRLVRVDYRRNGSLSPDPVSRVATTRIDYSLGGEKRSFFDSDGRPVRNANGAQAVQLRYDMARNPVEWRNLGPGGELTEDATSGAAIVRWRYDNQNRMIEESYFGTGGQPKIDARRGVATVRWRYDRDGNTLEESYFGPDDRPATDRLRGVAAVRWEYGPHGKTVEESYFGPDGRRMADKNRNVAVVRWQYDGAWNTVEERYFGPDLQPVTDRRFGAAIIRWEYDRYGRELGTSLFDQQERPMRSTRN